MRVRKREANRQERAYEIGKMAAIDELIIHGLSLVNTVGKKLLDDPEEDFSSDLLYADDRPISPM